MSRYPVTFQKPENALKRAEELINVDQKYAALNALHEVITSKRHRTWQKTLEKIMFKYVELCVEMKRGRFAKEGLIQYRIVCQQVNVNSLEEVIKHFLKLASEKVEQAQAQADKAITLDVEDLEASATPENLMLSYVSVEKDKDRQDRMLVTPWFKFLWETYRTVLEILRNNCKLEALYAMTAQRAFQFCLQYKRVTEFRRLCEILRNHLANLNKYRDQRDRPDLTQPESLQLYLETRFEQLKVATELELWQEAFRSVEDIHGLMTLVKKSPKPQLMAVYYAKLTKIFWKSENNLYHAYAWYKLYNLSKSYKKDFAAEDLKVMASAVVLSTLSVPPYDRKHGAAHFELELEKDRNLRMANLLGFSLDPKRDTREVLSRAALLSELSQKNLVALAYPEVQQLFNLLESEFHPLDLCQKVNGLLGKLGELNAKFSSANSPLPDVELSMYAPALEKLTILRTLQQVSHVYTSMKMSHLQAMIPFSSFDETEKLIVDAVKFNFLQMRIDYQHSCVHFGSHQLESERIRNHLAVLARRLNRAVGMVTDAAGGAPPRARASTEEILAGIEMEHKRVLARKVLIERRKEEQERQLQEAEREETDRRLHQQRINEAQEKQRQAEEARKREEDRIRRDIEEKENEEARALLEQVQKRKGKKGAKVEDGVKLDKRQLMEDALTEQIKERQEAERKLARLSKTMDHLERARREEEVPMLQALHEKTVAEDAEYFATSAKKQSEEHRAAWEADMEAKARMGRMAADKEVFEAAVIARRADELARVEEEAAERRAELAVVRAQERLHKRKKEYLRRLKAEAEAEAEAEAVSMEQERYQADLERLRAQEEEEAAAAAAARREAEAPPPREEAPPSGGGGGRWVPPRRRGGGDGGGDGDRYGGGGSGRYEPRRGGGDRMDDDRGGGDRWGGRRDDRGPPPPPRGGSRW